MDSDRATVSRSGSRPVTRWKREHESIDKANVFTDRPLSRSYSKMERPASRRGVKTDITEYGISRPPTTTRNLPSRPPSASTLSNRIPTAASRINTMNSANLSRMNTGLPRKFTQSNITIPDRPVTQQGLTAIQPVSSQDIPRLSRQIQDKGYYKQLLHLKIRELNQEMAALTRRVAKRNEEASDIYYNQKSKDLALKELQDQISDYNNVLDKMIIGTDREQLKVQARQLKELQDRKDAEIYRIFERRQSTENKIIELNKELEGRVNMAGYDDSELKCTSDKLKNERNHIQKEFDGLQDEYNQLITEKSKLEEKITSSMKQEAYKLYLKIFEAEQMRDRLLEEESNSLIFGDENVVQRDIIEIKRKISDAEQELRQLEVETNEDESGNQIKYNEMEKQDELVGRVLPFEKDRAEELEKLNYLEEQIVERLGQISNSINGSFDSSMLMPDEMEMLQTLMNQHFENHSDKTVEELNQEIIRLGEISNKLEGLELKIKGQTNDYKEKFKSMQDLTSISILHEETKFKEEMKIPKRDYSKLIEKFEQNEIYRPISILEDKLRKSTLDHEKFEKPTEEQMEQNYSLLLEKLIFLTSQYNVFLISDMKTVY